MTTYDINEGRLDIPKGWHDRSATTLGYPDRPGALRVMMSRHAHRGRPLAEMLDEILQDMGRRLAGYELLKREEILLDGEPAVEVHLKFSDGPERYDQRSAWFLVGKKCVAVGVLSTPKTAEEGEALFDKIRGSVRRQGRPDDEAPIEAAPPLGRDSRAY